MRKNIKKVAKIGVTGLLAAGLLVGSVEYASHMFVLTNKVVAKQVDKVKEDVKTSSKSGLDSEDVSKQETVYATLDANGKKTDVIVSDWLKNAANKGEVKDSSDVPVFPVELYLTYPWLQNDLPNGQPVPGRG